MENPKAVTAMRGMFQDHMDVAAEFGLSFLLTGIDYRANPDWGGKASIATTGLMKR